MKKYDFSRHKERKLNFIAGSSSIEITNVTSYFTDFSVLTYRHSDTTSK